MITEVNVSCAGVLVNRSLFHYIYYHIQHSVILSWLILFLFVFVMLLIRFVVIYYFYFFW